VITSNQKHMGKTRTKYTPQFKLKVVLEGISQQDISGTSRRYGVSYNLLLKWRGELEKSGHVIYEKAQDKEQERLEKKIEKLERVVGQKEVELSLLKNFSDFYASRGT